jgi:XTP/dITP diphosphohydrolase
MEQLIIATHNPGKTREIREILAGLPLACLSLKEFGIVKDIEETGTTYEANALLKARFAAQTTGLLSLGDDSGLEVAALGGRPGLHTARYAPTNPERWAKLLGELKDVPWEGRAARFVCVIALVSPGGQTQVVEGTCDGIIGLEPKGEGGFGYDPLFYMPEFGCTMAELSDEVKNQISHRGRAVLKAREVLEGWLKQGR